jgi:hypothetical protein
MAGLKAGRGGKGGEVIWRARLLQGRGRVGDRLEVGDAADMRDRAVSEKKEIGRRSGPPGGVWAGRRDGPAGLRWAVGKTWSGGRGKEEGELGCGAERKGVRGLGVFLFFKNLL